MRTYRNGTDQPIQYNGVYWKPGESKRVPFYVPDERGLSLLDDDFNGIRLAGGSIKLQSGEKKTYEITSGEYFNVSVMCFAGSLAMRFNNDDAMPPVNARAGVVINGNYARKDVSIINILGTDDNTDAEIVIERVM